MPTTPAAIGTAKEKFYGWLCEWVKKNRGKSPEIQEIVDAAAEHFAPLTFSEAINRREPLKFSTAHQKIVDFMGSGQWVSDDLAEVLQCRVEAAGARRRELSNSLGYTIESCQVSYGTWRYRLIDFPSNPEDGL